MGKQQPTPPPQQPSLAIPPPPPPSMMVAGDKPAGMIEQGNIDLANRPTLKNKDGSISTVRSMGVNIGGKEVLLPTVGPNGEDWTPNQAVEAYKKTGKHLGIFDSPKSSNAYAESLHKQQEKMYVKPGR